MEMTAKKRCSPRRGRGNQSGRGAIGRGPRSFEQSCGMVLAEDPFRWDEEWLLLRIQALGCSRFLVLSLSLLPDGIDGSMRRRWSTMPCMDSSGYRMPD